MSRLLYLNGDVNLARRTVDVYTQVVGKAWEARVVGGMSGEPNEEGLGNIDVDSHRAWVETLIFGARVLAKQASNLPAPSTFIPLIAKDKHGER